MNCEIIFKDIHKDYLFACDGYNRLFTPIIEQSYLYFMKYRFYEIDCIKRE